MFLILVIGWPQLWENPIGGFINVINYYKEVGVNIDYTPAFRTVFNFSTYPALWILYTTYPVVILLAVVGILGWIIKFKKSNDSLPLLFIIWFLILLIRASLPNTSIFGGVRHIIEYIPPLSFFAGYGVYVLFNIIKFRLKITVFLLIFISFIPFVITLIRLHPAENVYFNSFIGGLQGAKKANITGWGNTDGGIYEQAVVWLNKNAEKNSHIAVGFSEPADFYIPSLREDLIADNQFSGFLQKGEYIVALTHNSELEHTYRMLYPESSLIPVYDYKTDGVSLIKIWKNEKIYLKKDRYNLKDEVVELSPLKQDNFLQWDLGKETNVNYIELSFDKNAFCKNLSLAYFQVSSDQQVWKILPETYPGGPIDVLGNQPVGNKLTAPFVNIWARYIRLISDSDDACILNAKKTKFHLLK